MPHCPSTCTSRRPESLVSPPVSRTPTGCTLQMTLTSCAWVMPVSTWPLQRERPGSTEQSGQQRVCTCGPGACADHHTQKPALPGRTRGSGCTSWCMDGEEEKGANGQLVHKPEAARLGCVWPVHSSV